MNNTNGLISGDNKGYASYLMEKYMNKGALPGQVSGTIIRMESQNTFGSPPHRLSGLKFL